MYFRRIFGQIRTVSDIFRKRVIVNASIFTIGAFIQRAAQFFLIPVYTRFLSPRDYGTFTTIMAMSGLMGALITFGIPGAILRYYFDFENDVKRLNSYLTSNYLFLVIVPGLLTIGLSISGKPLWTGLVHEAIPFSPYVQIALCATYLTGIWTMLNSLHQAKQMARAFVYSQIFNFGLGAGVTVILLITLKDKVLGPLIGNNVAAGITALILSLGFLHLHISKKISMADIKKSLAYGLPLIIHPLNTWILYASDRLVLAKFVSLAEIGLYSLAFSLSTILATLAVSFDQAWMPYVFSLYENHQRPEQVIIPTTSLYFFLMSSICLIGILFLNEFLTLFAGSAYQEASRYLSPLLVSGLFIGFYFLFSKPLFYFNKTRLIPFISGSAALAKLALNILLIPIFGTIAAAWTTLGAFSLMVVIGLILGQKAYSIPYPLGKYGILVFLIIVITVCNDTGLFKFNGPILFLLKGLILIGYFGLSYKLLIKDEYGSFMQLLKIRKIYT